MPYASRCRSPRRTSRAPPLPHRRAFPVDHSACAALGENIAVAFELCLQERGGRFGGRAVTLVRLDDESDPAKAPQNVNRLLERDQAQVLVGTVHSGVVMALVLAAREREVPL